MKKWKKALLVCVTLLGMIMIPTLRTEAAANPLKGIPTKVTYYKAAIVAKGCDYSTKMMTKKFTLTASSSNRKVATVKVYDLSGDNSGEYRQGILITKKKPGTTKIKLKAVCGKKVYKKTLTYTVKKYANPFASLKIGKTKLSSTVAKHSMIKVKKNSLNGKLVYKLKKGYKITRIFATYYKPVENGMPQYKSKKMKNKRLLPKNVESIYFEVTDKNNVTFDIAIYTTE